MKKLISILVSLVFIVLVWKLSVRAEGSTYNVTIPGDVTISSLTIQGATYDMTSLKLQQGSSLQNGNIKVVIKGSGTGDSFQLARTGDPNTTIPFSISRDSSSISSGDHIDLTPSNPGDEVSVDNLKLTISGNDVKKAGQYTGNIVFTFSDEAA